MNERAAQALYAAEAAGVKQIKDVYEDDQGGKCALGVLGFTIGDLGNWKLWVEYGIGDTPMSCPLCGEWQTGEFSVIYHLNDDHGLTFSEIARKLGPDTV